jgi:hypothetical protein
MKKNIFYLLIGVLFVTNCSLAFAQTSSSATTSSDPVASSSASSTDKASQELLDKLKKVVDTKQKDQRAISGFATVKGGKITLKDADGVSYTINIDNDLTKVYQVTGASKKEIKSSSIDTGYYIIVSGPVADNVVTANTVYVDEAYTVVSGKITTVNKLDYSLTVITQDKDTVTVDIESGTKQNMLNIKTLEIETTGFSKIKEGDTIHFAAKVDSDPTKLSKFAAQKILIIPQEYFMK